MTVSEASSSSSSASDRSSCNSSCLRRYGALKDIPWRVYCKKACSADGDSWNDCIESCRALCHKDPVFEGKSYEWTAFLDRSPGDQLKSRSCDKACLRGCAYKFHVEPEVLAIAMPPKLPRPLKTPQVQIDARIFFEPPLSSSA